MKYSKFDDPDDYIAHQLMTRKRLMHGIFFSMGAFILIVMGIVALTTNDWFAGMVLMGTAAVLNLFFHGWSVAISQGLLDGQIRREIVGKLATEHALEDLIQNHLNKRKPTLRDDDAERYMNLTVGEDGELVPLIPDEDEQRQSRRR